MAAALEAQHGRMLEVGAIASAICQTRRREFINVSAREVYIGPRECVGAHPPTPRVRTPGRAGR